MCKHVYASIHVFVCKYIANTPFLLQSIKKIKTKFSPFIVNNKKY